MASDEVARFREAVALLRWTLKLDGQPSRPPYGDPSQDPYELRATAVDALFLYTSRVRGFRRDVELSLSAAELCVALLNDRRALTSWDEPDKTPDQLAGRLLTLVLTEIAPRNPLALSLELERVVMKLLQEANEDGNTTVASALADSLFQAKKPSAIIACRVFAAALWKRGVVGLIMEAPGRL
eukprot:TRINITY_DN7846_c0_g2_i1.p2 TRINITY_DN7846_c0_g2~~TRINITY_DN7846_c0_g2_i1.p2  ORF type:complete len:183 (-),score=39.46 TRINITY_DN7846_c0_g2_i1:427-975(-)